MGSVGGHEVGTIILVSWTCLLNLWTELDAATIGESKKEFYFLWVLEAGSKFTFHLYDEM